MGSPYHAEEAPSPFSPSLPPSTPPPASSGKGVDTTVHRKPINWLVVIPSILLSIQTLFTLAAVSLAASAYNIIIDDVSDSYYGDAATVPFVTMTLISGVVGGAAILMASRDLLLRTPSTLESDKLLTLLDLFLTLLASWFAWKEFSLRNLKRLELERPEANRELAVLEALVILLFLLKLFKLTSCFFNLFKRHGSFQRTCMSRPDGPGSC